MLKIEKATHGKKYKVYYDREVKNLYYSKHSCVVPYLTKYNCAAVIVLASTKQNNLLLEAEKTLIDYHHQEMQKVLRINKLNVIDLLPETDEQIYPLSLGKGFFSCKNVKILSEGECQVPSDRQFGESFRKTMLTW